MDKYDKTESSDGFAIFIVRHTQIFKAMHEYDKTESSDGFVIVMLKHIHMFKAFKEYDDKIGSSDVFVIHHLLYTLICSKQ